MSQPAAFVPSKVDNTAVDVRRAQVLHRPYRFRVANDTPVRAGRAYEYKWQKYDGDPTNATSNGVTLSVVFTSHAGR